MAIEKERKFLVDPKKLPKLPKKSRTCTAGYFTKDGAAVRVTVTKKDGKNIRSKFCIKSPAGKSSREEYEYEIPIPEGLAMLKLSPTIIHRTRWELDGWEIDMVELGPDKVLWIAEYEEAKGKPKLGKKLPDWVIKEVTTETKYYNQKLAWKYGSK